MQNRALSAVPAIPVLPPPIALRVAGVKEASALASLLGGAFPAETWEPIGTEEELFNDESVIRTLVVATPNRLLATASLQILAEDPTCAWLRWVGTESNSRRRGFARTLVISLLSEAASLGCEEVRLRTETDRLPALSLYIQLGFEPLARTEEERKLWAQLLSDPIVAGPSQSEQGG